MDYHLAEQARTEYELDHARTLLDLAIVATRADARWADEYRHLLREVVQLERTGYHLAPLNPAFFPQEPLA